MNKLAYLAFAVALIAFPIVSPNPYWIHIGQSMAFIAIAVIGLNLLLGLSGQLSLGQGAFYALGAYASAITSTRFDWPLFLSIPFGIVVATVGGIALGLIAFRTRAHFLAMATLAFAFCIDILSQRWIDLTGGSMGIVGIQRLNFGNFEMGPTFFFWSVACSLFVVQVFSHFLLASSTGRNLRAVKTSEPLAQTVGLNVSLWRSGILVYACALGGLSGALFAHQSGYVSSDAFGFYRSITFLFAAVLGGLAHPAGGILGSIILVGLVQAMSGFHDIQLLIFGGVVLATMLFFPGGAAKGIDLLFSRLRPNRQKAETPVAERRIEFSTAPARLRDKTTLRLTGVSKNYGAVKANEDVSLEIAPGTVHALIGPNGAGKSTLVNMIAGQSVPSSGKIEILGKDIEGLAPHSVTQLGLARTFQNLQLIDDLTVLENVMLGLEAKQSRFAEFVGWLKSSEFEAKVRDDALAVLAIFGLSKKLHAYPQDLSYGHRKLVELARAVAQRPSLLVLDEPVAGLNDEEAKAVTDVIRRLREGGTSILLIEHNIPFVMALSDEISVLDYGRIIASGPPEIVRQDAVVLDAYLGTAA